MEGNDRDAPARLQPAEDGVEEPFQFADLVVDRHAQRLKRARGGVVPGLGPPCRRIGALHKSRQFPGGFDGLAHPRLHDGPRDTPGLRIFPVAFDDVLQILKLGPIHKAAHRQFLGITVHAHIEGPIGVEAETAFRRIDLERRDADVDESPVDGIPADPVQRRFEFTVAGVHEMDAIPERSQTDTRKLKGLRVPVQTAQKALAARALHDGKGMAAHADRAVEIAPARFWGQRVHRFVQQYGNVYGFRRRHGSIGIHWFVSSCCKSIAAPAAGVFRLHVINSVSGDS